MHYISGGLGVLYGVGVNFQNKAKGGGTFKMLIQRGLYTHHKPDYNGGITDGSKGGALGTCGPYFVP